MALRISCWDAVSMCSSLNLIQDFENNIGFNQISSEGNNYAKVSMCSSLNLIQDFENNIWFNQISREGNDYAKVSMCSSLNLIEKHNSKSWRQLGGWTRDKMLNSPPHLEKGSHKAFLVERLNQSTVNVVRQAWSFFLFVFRHISVPFKCSILTRYMNFWFEFMHFAHYMLQLPILPISKLSKLYISF